MPSCTDVQYTLMMPFQKISASTKVQIRTLCSHIRGWENR